MLGPEQFAHLAKVNGETVLTDDYAPVENMLAEVAQTYTVSIEEDNADAEIASAYAERDYDKAIRLCREVLKRNEEALNSNREATRLRARAGYVKFSVNLGRLLNKKDETKEALKTFEEALKLNPDYPGLRHDLAVVLLKSGKPGEAAVQLRRALVDDPDNAGLNNQLGRSLAATNDKVAAADAFSRAVDLEPSNASYRANLGLVYEELGRPAEAIAQYRECLKIDDRNMPVLNTLARLLSTSSDSAIRDGTEAVRWAERLLNMIGTNHPARAEALDTLASAYAEAGQFHKAVDTARQAIQSANAMKLRGFATEIHKKLALYQAGRAYHITQ
jgi:tetratricopeptide (TPR) repeat protein